MAIEIITGNRRLRSFLTYDCEWVPGTLHIRVCGVFDGREYRHYQTIHAFLDNELTHRNRGKWFYAHAGGLADIQFVLRAIRDRPDFSCSASFSGSSAIIVRVRKGHNAWTFVDSYWLLKSSLRKVAKWIGMEKGGPAGEDDDTKIKEWYATVPMEQLIAYNESDCRILWQAVYEFQQRLLEYGGELMMTLASSAMRLFRRRYLKRDIRTLAAVNEMARDGSYVASRVEVFERWPRLPFNYYDFNSSFPYSMTFPCPGECIKIGERLPKLEGHPYIAKVKVEIPDQYLTTVPVRLKGRVFFPTGRFWARLCNVDIEELLIHGGKILKVQEVFTFEPFYDLAEYARDLYGRRKKTQDEMERQTFKLLLNSLYGKFAEGEDKLKIHVNPGMEILERLSKENQFMPGVFWEEIKARVNHMHVPIATMITARSRKILDDKLFEAGEGHFYYCDTDGFSTDREFPTGNELGELKLESRIEEVAEFIQPKLYRMDDKVKAKGFSLGWSEDNPAKKKRAIELFEQITSGQEIRVERMIRIRENLRKGTLTPKEVTVSKGLSKKAVPKRYTYRDGKTRPWRIEELKEKLHVH